jgi:hypothetical protein
VLLLLLSGHGANPTPSVVMCPSGGTVGWWLVGGSVRQGHPQLSVRCSTRMLQAGGAQLERLNKKNGR